MEVEGWDFVWLFQIQTRCFFFGGNKFVVLLFEKVPFLLSETADQRTPPLACPQSR